MTYSPILKIQFTPLTISHSTRTIQLFWLFLISALVSVSFSRSNFDLESNRNQSWWLQYLFQPFSLIDRRIFWLRSIGRWQTELDRPMKWGKHRQIESPSWYRHWFRWCQRFDWTLHSSTIYLPNLCTTNSQGNQMDDRWTCHLLSNCRPEWSLSMVEPHDCRSKMWNSASSPSNLVHSAMMHRLFRQWNLFCHCFWHQSKIALPVQMVVLEQPVHQV